MAKPAKPNGGAAGRNPERTRERILSAALQEFTANGFAGARVDAIARRAAINKRMLYHYFGNKEHLFREVLRRKITERQASAEGLSGDPAESLPFGSSSRAGTRTGFACWNGRHCRTRTTS